MKLLVTAVTSSLALSVAVQASRSHAQIEGLRRQAAHAAKLAAAPYIKEAAVNPRFKNKDLVTSSTISFANPAAQGAHALHPFIHVIR